MRAAELSGAAIGGIVAGLMLLLLVIVSSVGGYFFYRFVHKKSGYSLRESANQDIGMSFKNGKKSMQ